MTHWERQSHHSLTAAWRRVLRGHVSAQPGDNSAALPSSEEDAVGGRCPMPRQCNTTQRRAVDALPASGPGQSLAALQLADNLHGVPAPGGELQTASEADSTASPFHTWWGCLMPVPEGSAGGVPQTPGLGTSFCLAVASDHRKKKLKIEHLLAAVDRPGRPCLPLGLGGSRHLGEVRVQPARRPQAKREEGKRSKSSESQQRKHWLQEQQRQSRLMGRLGR